MTVGSGPSAGGRARYAFEIVLVAGAYYAAAKLGLSLAFETPSVTAIWPPTGIALAALILGGYRMWPAIALGAFTANAWTDVPLYTTLGITAGNTLEALVGAFLLNRFAAFKPSLVRVRDVIALFAFGGVISTMVSATIGTTSLLLGDEIQASDFGSVWRTWWLGDMGGDLVVAPALLVAVTHWPFRAAPGRPLEAVALALIFAGTAGLVFTIESPVTFLIFPPLIVIALLFWQPGAVVACLLLSAIAIPLTENDQGVFAGQPPDERLLLAQSLIGVASLTALVLAAVITERRRVEHTLEHIAGTLQESLLPSQLPQIPGIELAIEYRPAGEQQIVGGDFYDVFETVDGGWAVVVGDVLGKGATAAATTALARYTVRAAAVHETQPSRILAELNHAIINQTPGQTCTAAFARLALEDGGARIAFSTGGHPPPLLVRAGGAVELVELGSRVLGVDTNPPLGDLPLLLAAGDALVLYTDGVTDAYAPQRILAPADLAAGLGGSTGLEAGEIAERITAKALRGGSGKPRDDILVLVLRLPPSNSRSV